MATEIAIPFRVASNGTIAVQTDPGRQIAQHVRSLIATTPTERAMLSAYGCHLVDRLFDPHDDTVEAEVAREVAAALLRWEPNIASSVVRPVRNVTGDGIANIEVQYARAINTTIPTAQSANVNTATVKVGGQVLEAVHG